MKFTAHNAPGGKTERMRQLATRRDLSREEQEEFARHAGCRVQDLPLSMRGGLMRVMLGLPDAEK